MKVLVTGNLGFIGPFLTRFLLKEGHEVIGCDLDLFHESCLEDFLRPQVQWTKDFRQLTTDDLRGIDCLIHLAGISNDPMGDMDQSLTREVNYDGSCQLALRAKEADVGRFIYSSSCSIYGKSGDNPLTEEDDLSPLTAYASSKIDFEQFLSEISDDNYCTAYLRNATAFGYSPVFRIDLVVNNLLACAISKGSIRIMSDGEPWRPLLHCSDIARAFMLFVNAPAAEINRQAVNVGANEMNFQVKEIAALVQELVPEADIIFTGEMGYDPRNYKVSFDKLNRMFPAYRPAYTLRSGMMELKDKLTAMHFSAADFDGETYTRLRLLKKNLHFLRT